MSILKLVDCWWVYYSVWQTIPHTYNSFNEIIFPCVTPYTLFTSLCWWPLVYCMELDVNVGTTAEHVRKTSLKTRMSVISASIVIIDQSLGRQPRPTRITRCRRRLMIFITCWLQQLGIISALCIAFSRSTGLQWTSSLALLSQRGRAMLRVCQ